MSLLVDYVSRVYVIRGSLRIARAAGAHHPLGYGFRDQRGVSPGKRAVVRSEQP